MRERGKERRGKQEVREGGKVRGRGKIGGEEEEKGRGRVPAAYLSSPDVGVFTTAVVGVVDG